jgi:hypothetical protein
MRLIGQYIHQIVFGYKTNTILETLDKYAALVHLPTDNQSNAAAGYWTLKK